jgi:hypothetical protein
MDMEIETELFLTYKEYMLKNSKYLATLNSNCIYSKSPKSLTVFPTIVMKEYSNIDSSQYKSTDRQEFVNNLSYRIEIYTKDMIVGDEKVASKAIMNELKYLTFKFFNEVGCERTLCEPAEYLDVTVDRLIIIEKCMINSWNKQLSI